MSDKTIESNGKGFLVLLLPISFLVVFLVSTWRIWLGLILLISGINLWQRYRWEQWCQGVNPIFHQLIQQNQGSVTPMDLAIKGNFSGSVAKRFLDTKAAEFGASILTTDEGKQTYYFMTANILGSILDNSEPVRELPSSASPKFATAILEPPSKLPVLLEEPLAQTPTETEVITQAQTQPELIAHLETTKETESHQEVSHKEPTKTLSEQLVFGSLIQSELAKRLSVYSSTVFKRRDDPDFPEWSRNRDPDGVAWRYDRKTREFFPIEK